jgi:hypothetical protein
MSMETLSNAVERLERQGFRDGFRVEADGLRALRDGGLYRPEELVTEQLLRFEGESDPQDEAIVFALRSWDDRMRGILIAKFGPDVDPRAAELIRRLPPPSQGRPAADTSPGGAL